MTRLSRRFERLARAAAARPLLVLSIAAALAAGGGAVALGLEPSAGSDTLAPRSSPTFQATDEHHRRFGDDAIVVLIREQVQNLVLTADLGRLIRLEGCLAGPPGQPPYGGAASPCGELSRRRDVRVVYGPGTFLNESVNQVAAGLGRTLVSGRDRIARAVTAARGLARARGLGAAQQARYAREAAQLAQAELVNQLEKLRVQTGIQGLPRIDNREFISQIVFDPARGADVPKARFAYLFPSRDAALVQVRLRAGLSDARRAQDVELVRRATRMPLFRLHSGGSYTVTGAPAVVAGLAHAISRSIVGLLLAALLVMAATLGLVFRSRLRLLPLVIALGATGVTFGALAVAGQGLTMASIAVLPVLIGLGVDYAIQFQARVEEERRGGADRRAALVRAAAVGAPTIAAAGLATVTGFLTLLLSPVPMVRGFGLLLVVGIVIAFLGALTAGAAILSLDRPRALEPMLASGRGAREILAAAWSLVRSLTPVRGLAALASRGRDGAARTSRGAVMGAVRRPERVLGAALALAAVGWVLDTQTPVVSDVQRLVPADLPALRDVDALQRATGVAGEVDVTIEGADLARPGVVRWMTGYQQELLRRHGYSEARGCGGARLCPALSLPDLLGGKAVATAQQLRTLLASVPSYFSQAVISADRRVANLAFGIQLLPLSEQQRILEDMRDRLHPPPGVTARLAGLPVLTAEANDKLASSGRRLLTLLAGLLAVGLALFAVFRRVERAVVPLVPIALATGWSALVLWVVGIPLNPMSATLGALVIAISTEFSVLLSERHRQEREAGQHLGEALRRTYRSTGAAVAASGITAIAGFGVLVLSDIRMLREFGIVTVIDLAVSLAGVMLVLPAVLAMAERDESVFGLRRTLGVKRLARPRRRAPAA